LELTFLKRDCAGGSKTALGGKIRDVVRKPSGEQYSFLFWKHCILGNQNTEARPVTDKLVYGVRSLHRKIKREIDVRMAENDVAGLGIKWCSFAGVICLCRTRRSEGAAAGFVHSLPELFRTT
jgi:hypothetical protein